MNTTSATPDNNCTGQNTSSVWLKQLGVAALYALFLYLGEFFFDGNDIVGHLEPASGFALVVLLLGGKRYTWGIFFGATLIRAIAGDSLWATVVVASSDTLQAFCGAWLLARSGKFDLRLQSLQDYLRLILLGGVISVAIGALVVNTALQFSGLPIHEHYFHSLRNWWMSDTLGVILITPLILTWWQTKGSWHKTGQMIEALLLLALIILMGQIVFFDWLRDSIVQAPKAYWMFIPITWVAIRLGIRETTTSLVVVAVMGLFGAIHGTGYFAYDIAHTNFLNFWIFITTLSVVAMAQATHITERKNIEISLQDSARHLSQAQSIARIGSWYYDLVSSQLRWSDELYRIYGVSPETFTPNTEAFINLLHPDDRPAMLAWIDACALGQEPGALEFRCIWPDGTVRHIIGQGELIHDGDKPSRLSGTAQDITERKRAEEKLRIAAVTFETHEAILITDASSNIIRVNRAFTDITGYSQEEVLGKNPRILSSGRQDKAFYAAMWQQLLSTGSWAGEMWDRRKSGQIYPKWLTITAVKNGGGKTTEYVAIFNDISARKQAEEEIHNMAFYDALTRLPNRRLFLDRFRTALPASARHNNFGAVLFIDLDRFKLLNDTLGHDYGDLLLIEVAVRIKACVREMDTVARLGGDEFVVLMEGVSDNQDEASYKVGLVAEKIRKSLARPYDLNGHEHHSSPSIGVSLYRGNEEPVDELLQHADMAMYQAKDSGRNAVRFFDPVMQDNVATRAALVNDLRSAIAHRQLHLHYQLQVDNDNRPVGAEALLRWIHPQRGMVMPEKFLPIAEESTLILDICAWVQETACRQLVSWGANEKMRDLVLTVNISSKQFAMPDFVDKVANALLMHQINPARLKLELTESMALDNLSGAVEKMHALKALGVLLSMDDFGTRYSSLSNLKQLPLDQLKLGRSFVQDIASDGNVALLVQSIIDLSSKYRITVIAEGVENEAQLTSLKDRDCVAYQGFLFSKAVSIEEFEALMEELPESRNKLP